MTRAQRNPFTKVEISAKSMMATVRDRNLEQEVRDGLWQVREARCEDKEEGGAQEEEMSPF